MSHEIYEIEPHIDPHDKRGQRRVIWAIAGVFLFVNLVAILVGMLSQDYAKNLVLILDLIWWFDVSCAGVIGSFFGVDIVSGLTTRRTITMKKVGVEP